MWVRHTVVSIYVSLRHLQVVAGLAPLQLRRGTDEDQWPPVVPASHGQQVTWSTPKLGGCGGRSTRQSLWGPGPTKGGRYSTATESEMMDQGHTSSKQYSECEPRTIWLQYLWSPTSLHWFQVRLLPHQKASWFNVIPKYYLSTDFPLDH